MFSLAILLPAVSLGRTRCSEAQARESRLNF